MLTGGQYEIIASGEKTVWITELGRAADYGDFESFKTAIKAAALAVDSDALTVDYTSPSQGQLAMGWTGALTQNGSDVDVSNYGRYDNIYSTADAPARSMSSINFSHNGETLDLDYDSRTRTASSFLNK